MLEILEKQKKFFKTNTTLSVKFRLTQLKRLKTQLYAYHDRICKAFKKDLNKNEYDVVSTEIGLVMNEINTAIKHLKHWAKPKRVWSSIINFPAKAYKHYDPYGCVLVAAPWNYPFQLTMIPVIGAIAGGNTVVVKPSRSTPNVTEIIKKIFNIFDDDYVYIVTKDEEIEQLFDQPFDFIFYTGSPKQARDLAKKQAQYLTPMVLELGGKSPCIVDKDADIEASARRVVWGKFLNAGQTCVAPDYVLLHKDIKELWLQYARDYIKNFYYDGETLRKDFVKIINEKNLKRITKLLGENHIFCGGDVVREQTLEPTILTEVTRDNAVMQEEVFGPVMPVLDFEDLDEELKVIDELDRPLAFYYFGTDKKNIKKVKTVARFGGGCINDTIMHISEEHLPFGGVGNSGMGSYHGKQTFLTFTHEKSVLQKYPKAEIKLKYPPTDDKKLKLTKFIFRIK